MIIELYLIYVGNTAGVILKSLNLVKVFKLKEYFANLLKYNLYDLFSEIKKL